MGGECPALGAARRALERAHVGLGVHNRLPGVLAGETQRRSLDMRLAGFARVVEADDLAHASFAFACALAGAGRLAGGLVWITGNSASIDGMSRSVLKLNTTPSMPVTRTVFSSE